MTNVFDPRGIHNHFLCDLFSWNYQWFCTSFEWFLGHLDLFLWYFQWFLKDFELFWIRFWIVSHGILNDFGMWFKWLLIRWNYLNILLGVNFDYLKCNCFSCGCDILNIFLTFLYLIHIVFTCSLRCWWLSDPAGIPTFGWWNTLYR